MRAAENSKTFTSLSKRKNARYGRSNSLEEFTSKSQLMAYEGVRAMFEAYSRNKYESTGVVQWMLNNAWPSIIWHLYDFYLRPGGGYFGAKKAMEPLHPVYGYDDHSVWLVSSQYQDGKNLKLTAKIINLDMSEKFSKEVTLDALADSTSKIFTLPEVDGLSSTYFLLLRVEDGTGKLVGSNLYWISTHPETLDWEKSNWYTTPTVTFADYSALSQLPRVKLKLSSATQHKGERRGHSCNRGESFSERGVFCTVEIVFGKSLTAVKKFCPWCGKTTTSRFFREKSGKSAQPTGQISCKGLSRWCKPAG